MIEEMSSSPYSLEVLSSVTSSVQYTDINSVETNRREDEILASLAVLNSVDSNRENEESLNIASSHDLERSNEYTFNTAIHSPTFSEELLGEDNLPPQYYPRGYDVFFSSKKRRGYGRQSEDGESSEGLDSEQDQDNLHDFHQHNFELSSSSTTPTSFMFSHSASLNLEGNLFEGVSFGSEPNNEMTTSSESSSLTSSPHSSLPPSPSHSRKRRQQSLGPIECKWGTCRGLVFERVEDLAAHLQEHISIQRETLNKRSECFCEWEGCSRSGKALKSAYNLTHHLRYKHTGERPYACTKQNCESRFVQLSDLKEHMRNIHKIEDGHVRRSRGRKNNTASSLSTPSNLSYSQPSTSSLSSSSGKVVPSSMNIRPPFSSQSNPAAFAGANFSNEANNNFVPSSVSWHNLPPTFSSSTSGSFSYPMSSPTVQQSFENRGYFNTANQFQDEFYSGFAPLYESKPFFSQPSYSNTSNPRFKSENNLFDVAESFEFLDPVTPSKMQPHNTNTTSQQQQQQQQHNTHTPYLLQPLSQSSKPTSQRILPPFQNNSLASFHSGPLSDDCNDTNFCAQYPTTTTTTTTSQQHSIQLTTQSAILPLPSDLKSNNSNSRADWGCESNINSVNQGKSAFSNFQAHHPSTTTQITHSFYQSSPSI